MIFALFTAEHPVSVNRAAAGIPCQADLGSRSTHGKEESETKDYQSKLQKKKSGGISSFAVATIIRENHGSAFISLDSQDFLCVGLLFDTAVLVLTNHLPVILSYKKRRGI